MSVRTPRSRRLNVHTLEDRLAPAALQPLRVALISDGVASAAQVQAAAAKNVVAVTYDAETATLGSLVGLLEGVSAANGGTPIGHLGLVAHGRPGAITIGDLDTLDGQDVSADSATWSRLRDLLTPTARLDLYACGVAAGPDGKAFINTLAQRTDADVYASTDAVGSGKNADLVWEYNTGVRGRAPLFRVAALKKIAGLVLEDAYAPNQVKADADRVLGTNSPNLGVVTGQKTLSNLQLIAGDPDWFRFDTAGIATTAHNVRIEFENANGNLDLYVYEQDGTSLVTGYPSTGNGNVEQIDLTGKPAGTYYIAVYGRTEVVGNPKYTLQVVAPLAADDDAYEGNDGKADADRPTGVNSPNFGMLTGVTTVSNLVLDGESDWFKFQTDGVGTTADYVRLDFQNADGNIDLYVYEQDGTSLVTGYPSTGNGDVEQIDLTGKPAGTYYIKVHPRLGSVGGNSNYTLQIKPPAAAGDDPFERNDGKADADRAAGPNSPNLGRVAGSRVLSNLVLDGESDWFRFETTQPSTVGNYVRLDFENDNGNIDLYVYEQDGTSLVTGYPSTGNGDVEQIDLATYPMGTYYVKVYPRLGSVGGNTNYTLQILAPGSGLSVEPVTVTEGDGGFVNAVFNVSRGNGAGTASVNFNTADGTATAGADYIAIPTTTLNFANGETTKTVTVQVRGDLLDEPDESFFLNLSNAVGADLNTSQAIGTILDDDDAGIIQFSLDSYSIAESAGTAFIKVTRTGGLDGQVTVDYATDDGSAIAPGDYTSKTATLTFNQGEASKTIAVPIINDGDSEPTETVNLILTNATGGSTLGERTTAELNILASDRKAGSLQFSASSYTFNENVGTATITVNRVGGADGVVTVRYSTMAGTAKAGSDYTTEINTLTFDDGETSQTIEIEILNDTLFEIQEELKLTLSAPTGGAKLGSPRIAALKIVDEDVLMTAKTLVTAAGNAGTIKVLDLETGVAKLTIQAFPVGFKAGVRVGTGDVNGDGTPDIIAAPGPNGGTHMKIFDGRTGAQLDNFAHGLPVAGGVHVAAGDVNGDTFADIIVGAGAGAGPHVKVFSGLDRSVLSDFVAFPGANHGVRVAVGDVTGDGAIELIVGAGPGGPGDVKIFSLGGALLSTLPAFTGITGGVSVAVGGDLNRDGKLDIIVGAGPGAGPHVRVLNGSNGAELAAVTAYAPTFRGGVNVSVGDLDGDGVMELITGVMSGAGQRVKIFDLTTGVVQRQHSPYGTVNTLGVFVAGVQ
jgi:hypothetical protein